MARFAPQHHHHNLHAHGHLDGAVLHDLGLDLGHAGAHRVGRVHVVLLVGGAGLRARRLALGRGHKRRQARLVALGLAGIKARLDGVCGRTLGCGGAVIGSDADNASSNPSPVCCRHWLAHRVGCTTCRRIGRPMQFDGRKWENVRRRKGAVAATECTTLVSSPLRRHEAVLLHPLPGRAQHAAVAAHFVLVARHHVCGGRGVGSGSRTGRG